MDYERPVEAKAVGWVTHQPLNRKPKQHLLGLSIERKINYKSVMGLYFGTRAFITTQATRYASAHTANIMV